jgi:hypothetical protein
MTSNPSDSEQTEAEYAVAPGMPVVVRIFRQPAAAGPRLSAEGQKVWIAPGQVRAPVAARTRRACVGAIAVGVGLMAAGWLDYLLSAITP